LATALTVVLIPLAVPIAEETLFRGFFFGGLRRRMPRIPAALLSGLVFGAAHAPTGPAAIPPLAVLGLIFALLYEKTGSLVPGMILHSLNNSVVLLAAL